MSNEIEGLVQIAKHDYLSPEPIDPRLEFIEDVDDGEYYHICMRKRKGEGEVLTLGPVGWAVCGGYYFCSVCTAKLDQSVLFERCHAGVETTA